MHSTVESRPTFATPTFRSIGLRLGIPILALSLVWLLLAMLIPVLPAWFGHWQSASQLTVVGSVFLVSVVGAQFFSMFPRSDALALFRLAISTSLRTAMPMLIFVMIDFGRAEAFINNNILAITSMYVAMIGTAVLGTIMDLSETPSQTIPTVNKS